MGGIIIFACLTAHLVILLLVLPGESTRGAETMAAYYSINETLTKSGCQKAKPSDAMP